jgi:hypothetical protein
MNGTVQTPARNRKDFLAVPLHDRITILSTLMSYRAGLAQHCEELWSLGVAALLLSAQHVLGSVHDRHFVVLSTVTLQLTHILLQRFNLNHRIATLAIVVTAQPIRDRPCAAANVTKQELSARNLCDIYCRLRLRCRNSKNRN